MRNSANQHAPPGSQNNSANQSAEMGKHPAGATGGSQPMSLKQGKHFRQPGEELLYIKYLMSEKYKVFETPEVMTLRTRSIQYLQEIVETWYIKVGIE